MTRLEMPLETAIDEARSRWRWLRVSDWIAWWLGFVALGFFSIALLVFFGALVAPMYFGIALALLVLVSAAGLMVAIIIGAVGSPSRSFLALHLERCYPALLDRLNTLVYLEGRSPTPLPDGY